MHFLNVVGPQIRRLRYQRGWSQAHLAIKLQLKGQDISRGGVAKIESKIHEVGDTELLYLAQVLDVPLAELYPAHAGAVVAGMAAATGSMTSTALNGGHGGSLINTLAHMNEMQEARRGWRSKSAPGPDDITGDKAVQNLLNRTTGRDQSAT